MTPLEKAAKAIRHAVNGHGGPPWNRADRTTRAAYIDQARAAFLAVRTEENAAVIDEILGDRRK